MNRPRPLSLAALVLGATPALLACEGLLGIEEIVFDPCWDEAGFHGKGCYRAGEGCSPRNDREILNACTPAPCVPFDNAARIGALLVDGALPPLPDPGAGGGGTGGGSGGAPPSPGGCRPQDGTPDGPCAAPGVVPVYVTGSNAVRPILERLAPALAPIRIVFQEQSSCDGARAIVLGEQLSGHACYWAGDPAVLRHCALPPGTAADVGTCDVFADTCLELPSGLPPSILDHHGPIQAMTFVAPRESSERAISREAAYLVFGLGAGAGLSPFDRDDRILARTPSSGTQRMIARAVGVPPERWAGRSMPSSSSLRQEIYLTASQDVDRTIGIFDVVNGAETDTDKMKVLAYQAEGQACGFWPDRGEPGKSAPDKRNVRDGHYDIWGPLHLFSHAGGKPEAQTVINHVIGTEQIEDGAGFLAMLADGHLVPPCAMRVRRSSELGPLVPYLPPRSCACKFDELTSSETSCKACVGAGDCPAETPDCNFGYCEPLPAP